MKAKCFLPWGWEWIIGIVLEHKVWELMGTICMIITTTLYILRWAFYRTVCFVCSRNKAIADYLGANGFHTALEHFQKEASMVSELYTCCYNLSLQGFSYATYILIWTFPCFLSWMCTCRMWPWRGPWTHWPYAIQSHWTHCVESQTISIIHIYKRSMATCLGCVCFVVITHLFACSFFVYIVLWNESEYFLHVCHVHVVIYIIMHQ